MGNILREQDDIHINGLKHRLITEIESNIFLQHCLKEANENLDASMKTNHELFEKIRILESKIKEISNE